MRGGIKAITTMESIAIRRNGVVRRHDRECPLEVWLKYRCSDSKAHFAAASKQTCASEACGSGAATEEEEEDAEIASDRPVPVRDEMSLESVRQCSPFVCSLCANSTIDRTAELQG